VSSFPDSKSIQSIKSPTLSMTEQSGYLLENTLMQTIQQLQDIATEASKGVKVLYDTECKLADAENKAERALQLGFIESQGTVADRTAISRLQAADARLEADLAKAEYNRVKTKLKQLELAQMSLQTQARLLETELKTLR
jgi:hypothetical protein